MPSKSVAQEHLMQAAEHGATFPMAEKVRTSMSHRQIHDFAVGSEANKPMHVKAPSAPKSPQMRHMGFSEDSHVGNPGRKPFMRHGG